MQWRRSNLIWLLSALLLMGQSLLPLAALADVTVRCVGAPINSMPCARALAFVSETSLAQTRMASMACCRHSRSCQSMAALPAACGQSAAGRAYPVVLSAPKCLVSIHPLGVGNAALSPSAHRWLLQSAPALAPPVAGPVSTRPILCSDITRFHHSDFLPPPVSTDSHGLRAPPVA